MGQLSTDIYIFTASAYESQPQQLIAKAIDSDLTLSRNLTSTFRRRRVYYDTRYDSPLETPPLAEFASKSTEQWEKDPEKSYHNPKLYAIRDSKAYFLGDAVRVMAEGKLQDVSTPKYKYFFWEDAGAMRGDHLLQAWPDLARLDSVFAETQPTAGPGPPSDPIPLILFSFWRRPSAQEKQPSVSEQTDPIQGMISEGELFMANHTKSVELDSS